MINKYSFRKTPKIIDFITQINTYKELFEKIPKLPQIQENLLRRSTLKSALFSSRIEGNTLEMSEVENGFSKTKEKKEVFQVLSGLKLAHSYQGEAKKELIYEIHEIVMDGLTTELGRFRSEPSAIFNNAGIAIYIPPLPDKIPDLMAELIEFVNEINTDLISAPIAHFVFEKIHPFLDGNGRVGRILMNWHLERLGYGFAGLISFEEYLENNRDKYYLNLGTEGTDITEFVEFILKAISESAQKVLVELKNTEDSKPEDTLMPRRAEILAIIREQKMVSFDQIRRRFLAVSPRTLHYDLQNLLNKKLIRKLGSTRGVVYVPE